MSLLFCSLLRVHTSHCYHWFRPVIEYNEYFSNGSLIPFRLLFPHLYAYSIFMFFLLRMYKLIILSRLKSSIFRPSDFTEFEHVNIQAFSFTYSPIFFSESNCTFPSAKVVVFFQRVLTKHILSTLSGCLGKEKAT